ncbi:MAG: site-2 protease family protein [Candidatus Krumholzibacteria bacterium]|nr:site-2 protease family protein [Candidatus Krumholzibacteria bacterium]
MRNTIKFGSYFGIPVRIHFTFPLILVAFGVEGGLRGGWLEAVWAILLVLTVFVCVVLHEFGHSLQVRRYGIEVRDIVLLPIGGMARAEKIPEDPRQEIIVAISGPLVNFVIALFCGLVIWVRRSPLDINGDFLFHLLAINMVLGTFNLIPAFPMDGGRILRGLMAMRMPYLDATRYAKNIGQIIAILFVLIGFVNTQFIMLPLIAVFIFFGAIAEERTVRLKERLGGKRAEDFVCQHLPMLTADETLENASVIVGDSRLFAFPVFDAHGNLMGVVETRELKDALVKGRTADSLRAYVKTGFPLIASDTPASQVYHFLRSHKLRLAAITRQDNGFLGLITIDDLADRLR